MRLPFVWPIVAEQPRPYCGLGLFRWLRRPGVGMWTFPAPVGWRWYPLWACHGAILLPLWLYWPVRLWRDRHVLIFKPLVRLGVWRLRDEGGWWWEGDLVAPIWLRRLWWAFTQDSDTAPDFELEEAIDLARKRAVARAIATILRHRATA